MDDGQTKDHGKDHGKDARQQRLKQALRDNLKRRKAQARQRSPNQPTPANLHEGALAKDAGDRDE